MTTPYLVAEDLHKSFGHVHALEGADFDVGLGEVVALIGDNGAGKSTLVKILSGALRPDAGGILVDGTPVTFDDPDDARAAGLETVYQDLSLAPDLSPAENVFLSREITRQGLLGRMGFLDRREMQRRTDARFDELGVAIRDSATAVAGLSGGQRQGVAVARAVMWAKRIVFMDEPTAALGVAQTRNVLELVRSVRDSGIGVVLISHNMPDVLAVADRIHVLRLGRRVATFDRRDVESEDLVAAMTGATA